MNTSNSISINEEAEKSGGMEVVSSCDDLILWRLADGREVIETNGEPVWENDDGFEDLRSFIQTEKGGDR